MVCAKLIGIILSAENSFFEDLNDIQKQVVTSEPGRLLVLAGAGSGKTRVLVHRIAWLIKHCRASAFNIFAVTFTNKAANEMRSRVATILGQNPSGMWIGTFHGLAHRLLRLHWQACRLEQHFQIMDSDDQLKAIKKVFKANNVNEDRWDVKQAQNFINRKKDDGIRSDSLPVADNIFDRIMGEIYQAYERFCKEQGLVDFAELLLCAYELLARDIELKSHYQNRFLHFLVDEFQDTNAIQYNWLKLLSANAQSIMVVGDDDQSIYGWRGARIENIHRFEQDFPNTQTIRLEQNYRSTQTILEAANAVIKNNDSRFGKNLWTEGGKGELITIYPALNEEDEALFVVNQIKKYRNNSELLHNIAILYRSNAQSRILEEALYRAGIPYSIYGGLKFFERAEIKDALAYLRLVVNTNDNTAFERIINTPPRGLGEKSIQKIRDLANEYSISHMQAIIKAVDDGQLTGRAHTSAKQFIDLIRSLTQVSKESSLEQIIEQIVYKTELYDYFKNQKGEKAINKMENLEELINATKDFVIDPLAYQEESYAMGAIIEFLSYTALDAGDRKSDIKNGVQLMTLHAVKGLEFSIVFICGAEEGLFPHHFSRDDMQALEEERRLCYVGITRAMKKLFITYAVTRRLFGSEEFRRISRFVSEIPHDLLEVKKLKASFKRPYAYWEDIE